MYEMDWRQYDPTIARWVVIDPVVHYSLSPYNAFDNNPVFWMDPSGADAYTLAMEAFQNSGSGITTWSNIGDGAFMQTGHIADEDFAAMFSGPQEYSTQAGAGGGPGDVLSRDSFKFKSISNYRYARITGLTFTVINGVTGQIFESTFSLEIGIPIKGKNGKKYLLDDSIETSTMVLNAVATQYALAEQIFASPLMQKMTLSDSTLPYIFATFAHQKLNSYIPGSSVTANTFRYNVTEQPAIYVNWLKGLLQRLLN